MDLSSFLRRGNASAGHAEGPKTSTESGNAATEDGFASIGLPAEAGWYVSATLYWIGGFAVVMIDQLSSTSSINPVIGVLGTLALAAVPFMLLGAKFAPDAPWGAPVRILVPSIFFAVGAIVVGDAINALALLLLFPVLAVAYMHKPSWSIPYCTGALILMNIMLLANDHSDDRIARAIILTGVTAAVVAGLILMQDRLRQAAAANHNRSITDPLTGLANLRGLRARLKQELQRSSRDQREIVMFAIDLDDFKEVNDRFGHAAGDDLLRAIAERLERCVRDTDTLARIGGDEFAILIDGEVEQLEGAAERLRVALRDPFALHGTSVRVKASMGLVRPGTEGVAQTSDDLLRQADISMYAGKRLGKDTAVVYQPSSGSTIDFPTALRNADGEAPPGFRLVYQVVVQLPEGNPVAVEALARWTTPTGIEISPETFVAAAEAAGLAADLDALVLDTACRDVQQAGLDLDIHVNIGAGRLGNPTFEQQVRLALTRHHLPPNRLVVEITETLPIVDLAHAAAQIKRLNALGVKVALDDFGAGFNSLMYMHALPVQIVKLDRGLATADQARDLTLYRSVIGLCDELGLTVIVEGIESAAQSDTVYRAGGRLAQGHLYGYPVPISELSVTPARVGRV